MHVYSRDPLRAACPPSGSHSRTTAGLAALFAAVLVITTIPGTSAAADPVGPDTQPVAGDGPGQGKQRGPQVPRLDHPPKGAMALTMMEIGDFHGTMVPRPNLRPGDTAEMHEAGLAKAAWIIKRIRNQDPDALLFNAGDTIQGSAEVLYTEGQAIVNVMDTFGIDGYAPGNWDWLYGVDRTVELFGGPERDWGIVAANAYYEDTGERVFPAYRILEVKGVKIGVIGLTAERGLPAVPKANVGLIFTEGVAEVAESVDELRNVHEVDLVVLLSELGLGKNTILVEDIPGIDVCFSSDMHEETPEVVITPNNGTLSAEIGWGGSRVAVVRLFVTGGDQPPYGPGGEPASGGGDVELVGYDYEWITIEDQPEDPATRKLVAQQRAPFLSGQAFQEHVNPINGNVLDQPIDTPVAIAGMDFYRGNFANGVPTFPHGVLEGTSHNLMTDAFRAVGETDIGFLRGFRYGTYVRPGSHMTLGDLYTYLNAGARLATGIVTGQQLRNGMNGSINGSLNEDPFDWTGGWIFAYSGVQFRIDPTAPSGERAVNIMVQSASDGQWAPLAVAAIPEGETAETYCVGDPMPDGCYSITGYWFPEVPDRIGNFRPVANVQELVLPGDADGVTDPTEAVQAYLETQGIAETDTGRVTLIGDFPPPVFENPEVQPLRGVPGVISPQPPVIP